ncbi:hypothetical protein E2C01_035223 [Portunus trituberculatus]|uniref:Uncharacterized protein n=1 Tax=Portunus trituberculatus TaxID=210409 RepID=A0A5B7F553_PORTR|nr:hypothetical protein [Portunus trituberculatus]
MSVLISIRCGQSDQGNLTEVTGPRRLQSRPGAAHRSSQVRQSEILGITNSTLEALGPSVPAAISDQTIASETEPGIDDKRESGRPLQATPVTARW